MLNCIRLCEGNIYFAETESHRWLEILGPVPRSRGRWYLSSVGIILFFNPFFIIIHFYHLRELGTGYRYSEMGARSWFRVPGILGTRARGNANFIQERGTRKNRNSKFAFLWRNDTVMTCTERRGGRGDCGRDTSLTPIRLPASLLVHCALVTRGGG